MPWLMAGGTMQHPVVLDEATASRLGYGSSCVVGPSEAVRLGYEEAGRRRDWQSDENDDSIPQLGGTFRMWSDYKMALEGRASNVQAGTLLPPVLDMARTVADSFRRRWAAGGQYPELVRARVRLAERGGGDEGHTVTTAAEAVDGTATEAGREKNSTGRDGKTDAQSIWPQGEGADGSSHDDGQHDPEAVPAAGGDEDHVVEVEGGRGDVDGNREQEPPSGGLRQVLSRLDGLDSGVLVERALEDHLQGEGEQAAGVGTTAASGLTGSDSRRPSGVDSESSSADGEGATAAAAAAATGVMPGALSAALDGDLTATAAANSKDLGEDETAAAGAKLESSAEGNGDGPSGSGRASPSTEGMQQSPVEDKFMLPGWHYLALSGRSLSVDLRWDNMDLILMQDPTAKQGRDTGKNVLALRSSGALTVSSSGVGESVDVQLRNASLLPCFYAEDGDGGSEAEACSSVGPAQRLALILGGGGERALRAVERTWLGQGLVTADSRPLLEPFTVQIGYGTVVAQAVVEGRGTGVTDGRRRRMSTGFSERDDEDSDDDEDEDEEDSDDRLVALSQQSSSGSTAERGWDAGLTAHEDAEEQQAVGGIDQSAAGESVSGVFRVAVSELQLLGPKQRTEELATVEVEVRRYFFVDVRRVFLPIDDAVESCAVASEKSTWTKFPRIVQ